MLQPTPVFELEDYRASEDRKAYLHGLILVALQRRKASHSLHDMHNLTAVVGLLQPRLKPQQLTQHYDYCTYHNYNIYYNCS